MKGVVGAHYPGPGGVDHPDVFRCVLPEDFHVYQVGPAAFRHMAVQLQVVLRGDVPGSALLPGTESKQQKLVGQALPQALQYLLHGLRVSHPVKKIRPPLHKIDLIPDKADGPVQNSLRVPVHDGDDDFGPALAQCDVSDGQWLHVNQHLLLP